MTGSPALSCPACGAPAPPDAKFCGHCGTSLVVRRCADCGAELSPRARFCHRCGRAVVPGAVASGASGTPAGFMASGSPAPAAARSDRTPWIAAGAIMVVLVGVIVWQVERAPQAPVVPDMANPGAGGAAPFAGGAGGTAPFAGGPTGAAPDISRMSPRERFDRLFNRIMTAAERGDSNAVATFTPMALGAYQQLDTIDTDARYHAALLLLQVRGVPAALALADSIEAAQPGHLFGYMIRGSAAELAQNDAMQLQAYRDFLQHAPAEEKAGRPEYREHQPAIDEFRKKAEAYTKRP